MTADEDTIVREFAAKVDRARERGVGYLAILTRLQSAKCIVCGGPSAFVGNWCAFCDGDRPAT